VPKRIPRYAARYIRTHLLGVLAVLIVIQSILLGFGFYRYASLSNRIVDAQVANCRVGNGGRAQIRLLTITLRQLIDVSLTIPPSRILTPAEMAARGRLIQTFSRASHELTHRLPALAPRVCTRDSVTSGAEFARPASALR
jgi:hypothetical protein